MPYQNLYPRDSVSMTLPISCMAKWGDSSPPSLLIPLFLIRINDGERFKTLFLKCGSQSLPECNSSGSDLETHFAQQTKGICRGKTPSEKSGSESVNVIFKKRPKKDSHVLVITMETILSHQPPSAVVDLGLITAKAIETHFKCAEDHFTSLGKGTSNVLDSSVHQ